MYFIHKYISPVARSLVSRSDVSEIHCKDLGLCQFCVQELFSEPQNNYSVVWVLTPLLTSLWAGRHRIWSRNYSQQLQIMAGYLNFPSPPACTSISVIYIYMYIGSVETNVLYSPALRKTNVLYRSAQK